ncbi:MAG TPA: FtsX-like permease family protein, partial [Verrucomicrobiae bacterium]|nr:FtsX-like permease family protein [Verrucomicrobiae bacterium]
ARVGERPEVESVSAVDGLPLDASRSSMEVAISSIQGVQPSAPGELWTATLRLISPHYFETLGVALLRGRPFSPFDDQQASPVVIVNDAFARRYFPGSVPIGRLITSPDFGPQPCEIVGVIHDIRQTSLAASPRPEVFRPLLQQCFSSVTVVVRTHSKPAQIFPTLKAHVGSIDPAVPAFNFRTLKQVLSEALAPREFALVLMGTFAALALLLAAVGIYGVLSCVVNETTREIGIRLAVGGSPWQVLRLTLARGMKTVLLGGGAGLLASCALTRYLQAFLYDLSPTDPLTLGVVFLFLLVVALFACWVPARRAAGVDPITALRCE